MPAILSDLTRQTFSSVADSAAKSIDRTASEAVPAKVAVDSLALNSDAYSLRVIENLSKQSLDSVEQLGPRPAGASFFGNNWPRIEWDNSNRALQTGLQDNLKSIKEHIKGKPNTGVYKDIRATVKEALDTYPSLYNAANKRLPQQPFEQILSYVRAALG